MTWAHDDQLPEITRRIEPGTYMPAFMKNGVKADLLPTEVIERFRDALRSP